MQLLSLSNRVDYPGGVLSTDWKSFLVVCSINVRPVWCLCSQCPDPQRMAGWCVGKQASRAETQSLTGLSSQHASLGTSLPVHVCLRERVWDLNYLTSVSFFSHMHQNPVRVSCGEHDHISGAGVSAVTYIDTVHVVSRTFWVDWTRRGRDCSLATTEPAHSGVSRLDAILRVSSSSWEGLTRSYFLMLLLLLLSCCCL